MCLSIAVNYPECVLGKGEHLGYEWNVVHNYLGYRCGYIRIPKGHPWHGKEYGSIEPAPVVHGGLTFSEADEPCGKGADDAWWIGFDCGHLLDAPDPTLPTEITGNARRLMSLMACGCGIIRTQQYVEDECRSLCEQASVAAL